MKPNQNPPSSASSTTQTSSSAWLPMCLSILFYILLVIVGLRPLVQETHDTELDMFSRTLTDIPPVSPVSTLWINLIILTVFGITSSLRWSGYLPAGKTYGLGTGYLLLILAAAGSVLIASNRRLAMNASLDWVTTPLLIFCLIDLLRHPKHIRLTLAVILAGGLASAVESFDQRFNNLPNTITMYEQNKNSYWAENNIPPDSYQIALFERRIYEGASQGFFALANVGGSYFSLVAFVALAICLATRRGKAGWGILMGVLATIGAALVLTKSRGAILSTAIGLGIGGILQLRKNWVHVHRTKVFVLSWVGILLGLGCAVGYGLKYGHWPGGSLTYRWWYLEDAFKIFQDHPLLGVGSEHFGRFYTRYKDIRIAEEIKDPHNFLAHMATEWGIIGLCGVMIMLGWGSYAIACKNNLAEKFSPNYDPENHPRRQILEGFLLLVAIWTLRVMIINNPNFTYIYASNAYPIMGWIVGFSCCALAPANFNINGILSRWLGVALVVFLIHELINFALFVPGTATTFFALLGLLWAMRSFPVEQKSAVPLSRPRRLYVAFSAIIIVLGGVWYYLIRPPSRCWDYLTQARAFAKTDPDTARRHYLQTIQADPLDPTAAKEILPFLPLRSASPSAQIESPSVLDWALPLAQARDPENISIYRLWATASMSQFHTERPPNKIWLEQAAKQYEKVISLYPSNPEDRIKYADVLHELFKLTQDQTILQRAIEQLKTALMLNEGRSIDEVRRFSPSTLEAFHEKLNQLQRLVKT